jgi:integrase
MSGPVSHVKVGPGRIPIYYHDARGVYRAQWTENGKRREMQARKLEKLRARLRKVAENFNHNGLTVGDLTATQAETLRLVIDRKITPSTLEALQGVESISLEAATKAFLEAKRDCSTNHAVTLRTHLRQLCRDFGTRPLSAISTKALDAWLIENAASLRTRRNKRASIVSLWRWARSKSYLPQDRRTAAERTDAPSVRKQRREQTIETWSPDELKTILETVHHEFLPWVVLSAFAGIRTFELFPDEKFVAEKRKDVLKWSDIDLDAGRIVVPAAVSKTAEKRALSIHPTLAAWLRLIQPANLFELDSEILSGSPPWRPRKSWGGQSCIDRLASTLGTAWKKNALRHSFGTYRVQQTQSAGATALEMGNSERMIKAHYLDAGRTPDEAAEWFSLAPAQVDRSLRAAG